MKLIIQRMPFASVSRPVRFAAVLLFFIGCKASSPTDVKITDEPAGDQCAYGGVRIDNGSGDVHYVCSGKGAASGVGAQSVAITTEAPGANCPSGGLRVDDGSGNMRYFCNGTNGASGTNGESPTITAEPPGTNCPAGGFAVTAPGGAVGYLCNGSPALQPPVSLCPGNTLPTATASLGIFVQLTGATQGAFVGDAGAPVAGAIQAAATCYSVQSTATAPSQALVIITELDRTTPLLYSAWRDNEQLTGVLQYFDRDAMGMPVLSKRIDLSLSTVGRIEQITAEDPATPGTFKHYLRTTLAIPSFTEAPTGGSGATTSGAGYAGPPATLPCAPIGTGTARMFMQVTGSTSDIITGNATNTLAPDWIEVLGACHQVTMPLNPDGTPTGSPRTHGPLIVVKPQDSASVPLLGALFTQELLTSAELIYVRTAAGGGDESYFSVTLTNAHVATEEAFAQNGTRMDRVGFTYGTIEWQYLPLSIVSSDTPP